MAIELQEMVVPDAAALRDWLASGPTEGVWLTLAKKGTDAPTTLTYGQAVDEALCFGWIDGQARSHDDRTYFVRYTPRRARSVWSARNVQHVERLMVAGRMRPAGVAEVERAKADGRWERAYAGPATMGMDAELAAALEREPAASAAFDALNRQDRYLLLYRLGNVKRQETRDRIIQKYVDALTRGEMP